MPPDEPLVFLSCGGTIEKIYFPDQGVLGFDRSRVADWAKQCRISLQWRAESVMLIDSLEMTDAHRAQLSEAVGRTPESQIVVLHGTDTMVESAKAVMLQRKDHQTVVFTGAMVPASQEGSDALFNLGLACATVQTQPPGVYIAMSGRIFTANQARKNHELGIFEDATPAAAESENGTLRITKRKLTGFFR